MSVRKDAFVWLGVGIIVAVVVLSALFFIQSYRQATTVRIGDGVFKARIAATDEQRTKGLGGVKKLADNEAMLFVYAKSQAVRIWMKDMHIPIDAIWLDDEKRVIHIATALQPESYPQTYGPTSPARYIIEFPEGTVERKAVRMGAQAVFDDPVMKEEK